MLKEILSQNITSSCFSNPGYFWTSLVVQWLRLHAPSAGGPGLIPGQGTRSHMQQLRPDMAKNK